MRILHAIEGLDRASGVATFVHEVADEQAKAGHELAVIFVATDELSFDPRVRKISGTDFAALPWRPDVVHLHGIWSRFSLKVLFWCRRHGVPFVVSPHGGLMPRVFTNGVLKKRLIWSCVLRPLMSRAKAVHGTTDVEVAACKAAGLRGPFVVAPLGCRLQREKVGGESRWTAEDSSKFEVRSSKFVPRVTHEPNGKSNNQTILFLGRLSEEKGLVTLLEAWKLLALKQARLVIAGPDWNNYRAVLDDKIAAEGIEGVVFTGPADEAMKDLLYREADVFVLPSPMENFSMVVLDALAYGVPAIATKGTPWSVLKTERCGMWIDQGVAPLRDALETLLGLSPAERDAMGVRGRDLAGRKYQWPVIAENLCFCYYTDKKK